MRPLVGIALLTLIACGCQEKQDSTPSSNNSGENGDVGDASLTTDPVTYTEHIKPILDRRCTGCHSSALGGVDRRGAPLGVDYDTYQAAKVSADDAEKRIQAGVMPPGQPLPSDEKVLFEEWIDDGLLE